MENRIRLLRKQYELTQKELGNVMGFDARSVSRWERGEHLPDIPTMFKLAHYFNVSAEFLYCDDWGDFND